MPASSLLDLIGNTPLVELPRLSPPGRRIYAKLEGQNPTGSIKDRVALAMVEAAELEPGQELLEPTSGNTGISLALVAKLKGLKLTCVMPANATPERRTLLELYGATIVDSPGEQGSNGAVRLAQEIAARDDRYVMLFQYANEANPRAHYEGTGAEIVRDLPRVDALVAGLGTGGTLMGTGARVREAFPDVQVVAAEPLPGDPVMGLRSLEDGYVPPILDVSKLDRKLLVSNAEAAAAVRALLDREGLFAGVSAGAVVHVARRDRRGAARGSGRRRGARRRRLEVPLGPVLVGRRDRRGGALVVIPARDPRASCTRTPPRRRRTSAAAWSCSATASPSATSAGGTRSPRRTATSSRSTRGLVPRGRGLRARGLPLAPGDRADPVAHRPRARRPLGGPFLIYGLKLASCARGASPASRRGDRAGAGT